MNFSTNDMRMVPKDGKKMVLIYKLLEEMVLVKTIRIHS